MEAPALRQLYIDHLHGVHSAERLLLKALPGLVRKAGHPDLRAALEEHVAITRSHSTRLAEFLAALEEKPRADLCKGMQGLIEESAEMLARDGSRDVVDAELVVAAQKFDHYAIAAYGALQTFAETLGDEESADVIADLLAEERDAEDRMNEVALRVLESGAT